MQLTATERDIEAISSLVEELCGIHLDSTKGYLVESRLSELAERHRCDSYSALAMQASKATNVELRRDIVDKMTTNETSFFRDFAPFDAFQHKVVPNIIDAREATAFGNRIRIWSAGCSTGQEPYTIGIVLSEMLGDLSSWDISILGTDISNDAIRSASLGIFPDHHISRGLPGRLRDKYFTQRGKEWQVRDEIRSLVRFQRANLLESFTFFGQFDIIFCRNVAIYFTRDVRIDLFQRFADSLAADGYLFVGSAEAMSDLRHRFYPENHCGATVYCPLGQAASVV